MLFASQHKKKIFLNFLIFLFFKYANINKNYNKYNDDFLNINNIKTNINCLHSTGGNIGNALIILNNLINLCENIKCKYILTPGGLDSLIKNPIFYKEYNLTILPYSYKYKVNISLILNGYEIFLFRYKNKLHKIRMNIIKNEIISNLPRYIASPEDLYINIRSGDIFTKKIHVNYAQPPLCFYQKIINDDKNKFKNIYLISNGHENPVVDIILKLYPKIKFIHGTIIEDASVLVNVYNLILPISSFPYSLIRLNNNLRKLYIYDILVEKEKINFYGTNYYFKSSNFSLYIMKPSLKYELLMKGKWKNTKEQLNLMVKENCFNSSLYLLEK